MLKHIKLIAGLLYPKLCIACSNHEPVHDNLLCHSCWKEIPRFSDIGKSRALLEHRFPLIYGENISFYGLYLYSKKGGVQNILHQIKYGGKSHIALELGRYLGKRIPLEKYNALIPVPLHYKKMRRRGYNQAEIIAKGISESTGIPLIKDALEKKMDTDSQTKMDRSTRHANVMKAFINKKPLPKSVNNVILIDDVVTTGATLDICSHLLKKESDINVDFGFIAMSITS